MSGIRHITLPAGFVAAGVRCGIKASGEDLAVIVADRPVPTAVVTTSNQVVGAPIIHCRQALPTGRGLIRGIVINSGNANVCTGPQGLKDVEAMAAQAAEAIGAETSRMLVASTGIIGRRLPMANIRRGIAAACDSLGRADDSAVVRAIMTTDTREKSAVVRIRLGGQAVTVAGIVKGAGMIAPSMATLISVITTDASVAAGPLYRTFKPIVAETFNAVTVDSDQSTSDIAMVMASGRNGPRITAGGASARKFSAALGEVCLALAVEMARDGEGATRLIQVNVTGAANKDHAAAAAKSVANSPLFKCAVHGGDPNWGRIVMAVGKSAAKVDPDKLSVKIGRIAVFSRGTGRNFDLRAVRKHLAGPTVVIDIRLGAGEGKFTAYTCDLSRQYVTINADYHT